MCQSLFYSMIKRLLIFILLSAVSFQSFAIVTDYDEVYQTELVPFEFENVLDMVAMSCESNNQITDTSFECEHCCHCPGCHQTPLLPSTLSVAILYANHPLPILNQSIKINFFSRLLRPPQV